MCEARGLPVTRIGVVDQGSDADRGAGPVHGLTGGPAQHVGGRAARVVRVSVPTDDITGEPVAATHERKQRHPLLVWAWSLVRLDFVGDRVRRAVLLPVADAVTAAARLAVPGSDRRAQRRHRLRHRRVHPERWCAASCYGAGDGGRRRSGCSTGCKAATIALSTAASLLMLIPAAAWQRRVSAEMGMEGPGTVGYLRTLIIAMLVTGLCVSAARVIIDLIKTMARYFIRRWHLHDEVALFIGTAIVVVLAITLINGVLIRGFLAGANRVFQPQNTTTRAGDHPTAGSRTVRQPNVFRAVGHAGFPGPQLRRHRPARRRADPAQRRARQGAHPGLRGAADRRHRSGASRHPGPRAGPHARVRPQGARHHPDDRHRVDQPRRRAGAGVDVQRRHRDGRIAVLLSAELDFVPRRPGEVDGVRSDDDRRGPRLVDCGCRPTGGRS